ncbi:ctr copper transporter family protein [Grosmannia clavigera kw1407]|uniref:Ctr copper transporter family protein n=1 Tax=Grosmannia clavigera (strain kw1407 / UAMH 11150) TaxID=655863 RepID=F0XK75_GROCL|nr:ctr copper transporter family protein [Grosmannia clavigera kw1407]EFX01970.1 ctr copper transporter family protein [Grosmannia clavigera kw1407]
MDMSATTTAAAAAATSSAASMSMGSNSCQISVGSLPFHMLWNWHTIDACFVSESWHITSRGMFAGSCIGVICLVMSLEMLRRAVKEFDRFIVRRHHAALTAASPKHGRPACDPVLASGFRPTIFEQAVRALLHMLQFAVAYFVMLLAMYYNGYVIICIFIGSYLGSFIFQWEVLGGVSSVGRELAALKSSTAPFVTVTQNVNVSARYCEPEVEVPGRENSIQVLVHGITYSKVYWSALGFPGYQPQNYSWVDFASKNGYATLAIDRPGNGNSSTPNPFTEAQIPFFASMLRDIADGLRSEKWLSHSFDKLIYVGHSLGSVIGNAIAVTYPDSYDAMVLTGFSKEVASVLVSMGITVPAATFNSKFADRSTGYIVTSSEEGRRNFMYGTNDTYDLAITGRDYNQQGVTAIAELATITFPVASNFTGAVTVVTGQQDVAFCYGNSTILGDCGQGDSSLPAQAQTLFPNASSFAYYVPEQMGHDLNLHYKARDVFKYVHDWLAKTAF